MTARKSICRHCGEGIEAKRDTWHDWRDGTHCARRTDQAHEPQGDTREILVYGALPEPCYVLRIPTKGVRWRVLMAAAQRLVKALTHTPKHKAAPDWYIDGDAPPWETTKQPRYIFNVDTKTFDKV
jgi:hypothetical protein